MSWKWKHGKLRNGMPSFFFCVKLCDNATTTHVKLQQAFAEVAMSRAQTFRWLKMFTESRTFVEDEQRSGRPSTTRRGDNTARVRELVRSHRRLTIEMIADQVNMNRETVRLILTEELGMRKICANTLRTGDVDLRFYITIVQDG